MAKVKYTEKGNVKVTMTPEQFDVLHAILGHVRLGNTGNAAIMAELAEAMSEYAGEADYDIITFSVEEDNGSKYKVADVTIETD